MTSTFALTFVSLVFFAANSLLCRAALGSGAMDAASFTAVRLLSGAAVLAVWVRLTTPASHRTPADSWTSAVALFTYALAFSFAYLQVSAGVGALVLFGAVQVTMIGWGLARGERMRPVEALGLALALGGLVVLTLPGVSAPPLLGFVLMLAAGVAWGLYSLRGRGSASPLQTTAANFARTVPLVVLAWGVHASLHAQHLTLEGALLGVASGALASGVGYAVWYRALARLRPVQAASVQLAVPLLAALGGVLLLGERLSFRLLGSAALILGGIALCIRAPKPAPEAPAASAT